MSADRLGPVIRRLHFEDGSMVVALMAVIVASGLMLSITAAAVTGHRAVGFDRDHVRVVQGADAGVEEVVYRLSHPVAASRLVPTPGVGVPMSAWQNSGDAQYRYEVVPYGPDATAWQVNSQARINGVTRRVSAVLAQDKPFKLVAFADSHMVLRGGNLANSYGANWNSGNGNVGSNGTITLNGSVDVDKTQLWNFEAAPDLSRCTSNGNTECSTVETNPPKLDVSSIEAMGFIDDATTAIPDCNPSAPAFTGTSLAGGQVYCFSTMTLSANFTVTGTGPAIVYLTNNTTNATFSVGNKLLVNCTLCTGTNGEKPDASKLQIFTKSVGPIRIGNHSHVAASIYAPRATCGGNPSNAGANFYGSMVCAIVTNQGAWNFHYDDRLASLGVGGWRVQRWSEE